MINPERTDRERLTRVRSILNRYPGPCRGFIHVCLNDQAEAVISMDEETRIRYCDSMTREVNAALGYHAVHTRVSDAASAIRSSEANGHRHNGRRFANHG
jgi:DNA polymerase-3 subunit alpha